MARYLAPEFFARDENLEYVKISSPGRDIWAFGCLLSHVSLAYMPLTSRRPAKSLQIWSYSLPWLQQRSQDHIRLEMERGEMFERPPGVSDEIWRIVLLCCTFDPSKRPTAAAILQELEALQSVAER